MKRTILSLAIVVLVVAAIRVPLLNIPFERDEGEYAYIAWRLEHRELPYRDWIDQKPPAIFLAYRLALSLPLEPVRAVHSTGFFCAAASACALFLLASRFMGVMWAVGSALLFALLSGEPSIEGTATNTELLMLLPLILSQILFFSMADNRRKVLIMIMAGVLTGIAAAFKQVAAVNWFFLVALYPIFVTDGKRGRQTLRFGAWSAAGVVLVWGAIAAYFTLRNGLADFIYNVFTHNVQYIHSIPWSQRVEYCRETLAALYPTQALVWIFALAGMAGLFLAKRKKLLLFLAGWMVTSLIGVSASGYFFPHYFQQVLPVLAVAAALGAEALDKARFWSDLPIWFRATMLGGTIAVLPLIGIYPFVFSYSPAEAAKKIYPTNHFAEMRDLGKRIAQITQADDRVFIFGSEPEVFFYARRVSATRYIFLFPLYGPYGDALDKQVATAREISASRPAAALFMPNSLFVQQGTEQYFTIWTQSYLRDNFRPDTCLTIDPANDCHIFTIVSNQVPSIPKGQRIVGIVSARIKNRAKTEGGGTNGSLGKHF